MHIYWVCALLNDFGNWPLRRWYNIYFIFNSLIGLRRIKSLFLDWKSYSENSLGSTLILFCWQTTESGHGFECSKMREIYLEGTVGRSDLSRRFNHFSSDLTVKSDPTVGSYPLKMRISKYSIMMGSGVLGSCRPATNHILSLFHHQMPIGWVGTCRLYDRPANVLRNRETNYHTCTL